MLKVNGERLKEHILQLGAIGKNEAGGITRLSYSKEYREAADLIKKYMEDAGLQVMMDPVGNVIGERRGKSDRILMLGSHIDSVPNGGMFDGTLGVLGAIEALQVINEAAMEMEHTVRVVSWAEEEGNVVRGLIGSAAYIGELRDIDQNLEVKLQSVGITTEDIRSSEANDLDRIEIYVELHIEQGGVLDSQGINIGAVTGIMGNERYKLRIQGEMNHAGTTPMNMRNDSVVKAAGLILHLNEMCRKIDENMVCTTGMITAYPGAQNVIADFVEMSVEIRCMSVESIKALRECMLNYFSKEECEISLTYVEPPVPMSPRCMTAVEKAADLLGLSKRRIHSGAGHDAMMIARKVKDVGMIFAPSIGGRSHCPQEFTKWEDVRRSTNVLLQTLLELDQ